MRTQYSLAGLHPHVTRGNEGQEGPQPGLPQRWPVWRLAPSPGHCPPPTGWGTKRLADSVGKVSAGRVNEPWERCSVWKSVWFLLDSTGRDRPPAHLLPSPPCWEWGSRPSFLEGGGEWPEQGTPERLSACPRCQHSMGMGREGRQGAGSLRWEKRHQRARELRGLAHARGQRTQCSHRSLPGGGKIPVTL